MDATGPVLAILVDVGSAGWVFAVALGAGLDAVATLSGGTPICNQAKCLIIFRIWSMAYDRKTSLTEKSSLTSNQKMNITNCTISTDIE